VNDRPRTIPVHASLMRPILMMGAERELLMISGIIAAVLVMSLERLLFTVVGVVFWCLSLAALQRAAKADPQFSRVYLRHARYRAFYAAQSRVTARISSVREGLSC
jgi:type IV secretory pathway TrbD component